MKEYTFVCPLPGCGQTLSVHADNNEQGAVLLTEEAKRHLQQVHPDVHKTNEEVASDIRSHMGEE